MKSHILVLLLLLSLPQVVSGQGKGRSSHRENSAAGKSVTGTYQDGRNTLRVLELPGRKLLVDLDALWPKSGRVPPGGPHVGGFTKREVVLSGNMTVVRLEDGEYSCKITMKFLGNKVLVSQEGECGWGAYVTADGMYMKRSKRRPNFLD